MAAARHKKNPRVVVHASGAGKNPTRRCHEPPALGHRPVTGGHQRHQPSIHGRAGPVHSVRAVSTPQALEALDALAALELGGTMHGPMHGPASAPSRLRLIQRHLGAGAACGDAPLMAAPTAAELGGGGGGPALAGLPPGHPGIAEHYRRFGFVVVSGMLGAAEAAEVRASGAALVDNAPVERGGVVDSQGRPCVASGLYSFTDPARADDPRTYLVQGQRLVLNRINDPLPLSLPMMRAYGSPHLLSTVQAVYGADFCPFAESLVLKNPTDGAGFVRNPLPNTNTNTNTNPNANPNPKPNPNPNTRRPSCASGCKVVESERFVLHIVGLPLSSADIPPGRPAAAALPRGACRPPSPRRSEVAATRALARAQRVEAAGARHERRCVPERLAQAQRLPVGHTRHSRCGARRAGGAADEDYCRRADRPSERCVFPTGPLSRPTLPRLPRSPFIGAFHWPEGLCFCHSAAGRSQRG